MKRKAWKSTACMGFKPLTSVILVQCSTNNIAQANMLIGSRSGQWYSGIFLLVCLSFLRRNIFLPYKKHPNLSDVSFFQWPQKGEGELVHMLVHSAAQYVQNSFCTLQNELTINYMQLKYYCDRDEGTEIWKTVHPEPLFWVLDVIIVHNGIFAHLRWLEN